ncbi:MAG: penicillin-binding transpeptidase domain-containing protein [Parcubacteria group bacterium]|jgi:membrane peptidoglycan carboxypeptidase
MPNIKLTIRLWWPWIPKPARSWPWWVRATISPSAPDGCVPGKNCKFEGNYNVATALRQPGSSFKPYVYLTAFQKGYTPETQLWDVDIDFDTGEEKDYNPKNYDGKNHGLLHMKDALAMSLNVPAVETLYLAGVQDSVNTARSLGITSLTKPDQYGLSLVLGGGEVTLLDHVNAYSTLATGGIHHDKTAILKVLDNSGKALEQYQDNPGQRVIDEKYVGMLDYVMSTNDLRAPVFGTNNPLAFNDRPVAAKTGTTNEWRDGWTIGFTPSLVAGVWSGNNDNTIMAPGADGIFVAAPLWRKFMDAALKNNNVEQFPKYETEDAGKDILNGKLDMSSKLEVCEIPGEKNKYCLASDACPDSEKDKKEFFTAHNILYYVNKDDPRGDAPEDPSNDPQHENWEKAVLKWVEKNTKLKTDDIPEDECKDSDFSDYKASVSLEAAAVANIITISGSVSAPYGIKNSSLTVDGSEISQPSGSFNTTYDASAKNGSDVKIKLTVTDNNGHAAAEEKTVHIAF